MQFPFPSLNSNLDQGTPRFDVERLTGKEAEGGHWTETVCSTTFNTALTSTSQARHAYDEATTIRVGKLVQERPQMTRGSSFCSVPASPQAETELLMIVGVRVPRNRAAEVKGAPPAQLGQWRLQNHDTTSTLPLRVLGSSVPLSAMHMRNIAASRTQILALSCKQC